MDKKIQERYQSEENWKVVVTKHLGGQHDQQSHAGGNRAKLNIDRYGKNNEYAEVSSFEIDGVKYSVSTGGDAVGRSGYNGYLVAYAPDGQRAGYLDYNSDTSAKTATVAMIEVEPQFRNKGIAEALLDSYLVANPNYELSAGYTTEDGAKWWRSVTGGDGPIKGQRISKHLGGKHDQQSHAGGKWTGGTATVSLKPFSPQVLSEVGLRPSDYSALGDAESYPKNAKISAEQAKAVEFISGAWIRNSGSIPQIRSEARKLIEEGLVDRVASGERIKGMSLDAKMVARTLTAVRDAPTSVVWRGLQLNSEGVAKIKVGAIHEESLATATGRRTLARGFAIGNFDGGAEPQGNIPVLLKINARNVPVGERTPTRSRIVEYADERFISGRYKVDSVIEDPNMGENGGFIVEMSEV